MAKYDRDRVFILHSMSNGTVALHVKDINTVAAIDVRVICTLKEPGLLKPGEYRATIPLFMLRPPTDKEYAHIEALCNPVKLIIPLTL